MRLGQPKWVKKQGKLVRIESATQSGIPDVHYTVSGHSGWIELKVIGSLPRVASGIVKVAHFKPVQREWIKSEMKCGGMAFVFLLADTKKGRKYFLFDGLSAAMELGRTLSYENAIRSAVFFSEDTVQWDTFWERIISCKRSY